MTDNDNRSDCPSDVFAIPAPLDPDATLASLARRRRYWQLRLHRAKALAAERVLHQGDDHEYWRMRLTKAQATLAEYEVALEELIRSDTMNRLYLEYLEFYAHGGGPLGVKEAITRSAVASDVEFLTRMAADAWSHRDGPLTRRQFAVIIGSNAENAENAEIEQCPKNAPRDRIRR